MPFPLVEFQLTPEQLKQLAPLAAYIKAHKCQGTLVIEAFVVEGDHRYGAAKARYLDNMAVKKGK